MYKQSFRALSVLLLLALLSANVSADPVKVGNLYYNFVLKAKIASVTAPPFEEGEENEYGEVSGKCYEGDVVIPATVEYKGVVCNVTSIEDKAFCCLKKAYLTNPQLSENNKLTSVSIPESVTSIGTQAFYCCVKLSSISLPESVSKIGDSAFSGCTGLVSAKLKGLTTIPAGLFASCTSLETLDISENITEIGSSAFASCVNLPSVDLKNVEKIDDYAFYRCSKLITINMSDNLKKIGRDAFRECSNLSTIKWSENLREIDDGAFYYCKALNSVELPNNVKSIGVVAFSDCSNLMTVKIGSNLLKLGQSAFANCTELTDVYIYGQLPSTYAPPFNDSMVEYSTLHVPAGFINFCKENSPWNEFGDYVALSDEDLGLDTEKSKRIITFEDPQVKAICVSNWDFNGDGELSEAEAAMPVSFSNIALWDSDNNGEFDSEEIRIAEGTYEFVSVFKGNTKIKTFNELKYFTGLKYFTEKEMKCIEVDAFYGCTNLEKVTLPEGVTIIDVRAFGGCSSLSSVMIPDNVTTLGSYAFYQCSNLTSVTIGEKVQRIGDWAFFGCSCVTSIIIPESVTEIGNTAFSHSGLTSVSLPSGITKIEAETFGNCTNLTTVTIPCSVMTIGDMAFSCDNLTSVTVDIQEPLVISDDVFSNRANATLYVPKGSKSLYELAEGWKDFKTIEEYQTTNPNAPIVFADDNVKALCVANWDVDGDGELSEAEAAAVTDLGIVFKGQSEITSFNELEYFTGLTTIPGGTFAGCSGMTSVMIPSTVTSIGNGEFPDDKTGAFSNCSSLTSLTIPEGVTSIGTMAFSGCHGLTMMTIPKSVGYIGNGVFGTFNRCSNLIGLNILDLSKWCSVILAHGGSPLYGLHLYVNGEEVHDLIIPDDVTYIAGSVFGGCKGLSSVTIPSSVTEFGRDVFYDNNELTSVIVERAEPLHLDLTEDFFSDRVKATLFVPEGSVEAYAAADYWKDFKKIKVIGEPGDHKVGDTFTVDGVLYQVTSVDPLEVQVGNGNSNFGSVAIDKSIEGAFEIPATVTGDDENVYSVTAISKGAFSGCSGMTSVTIPNSVTAIAGGFDWGGSVFSGGAFENCGLITLTIPSSVTSIGEGAFTGCYDLTSIVVEEGNTVYDSRNNCNAIIEKEMNFMVGDEIVDTRRNHLIAGCKNTIIPDDVISIGTGAFLGCKFLTSIDIPNSVTYISDYAFWYCVGLTSLNISENVTSIGTQAFAYCTGLTSITIPESVKTIWHDAFYGCRGLVSASILPKSLSKYGLGLHSYSGRYVGIFGGCENLTTVIVGAEEPFAIGGKVLDNSANATLYVPKGSKEAYAAADYWKDFKEIKEFVNDESATYIVEDDKTVAVKDVLGSTGKDVEIPESVTINGEEYVVTAIAENAFENNETLEQVTIPATIEKIGDAAFAGCTSLKVIYSYAKEPIPLGSVKAKVRTRADGEEISASTVFAEVDKETCVLYVPSGSADKYRAADGWGEFKNIVEMDSEILGDANNDGKVDADDIEAITRYIMEGDDEGFIFRNADVNCDEKINAADIVEVVNIIKADK